MVYLPRHPCTQDARTPLPQCWDFICHFYIFLCDLHLQIIQVRQKVKDNQGEDLYAYGILLISLQRKCEQYWNDQLDKPYDAGSITVVTTRCRGFADYVVRDLTLRSVSLSVAKSIYTVRLVHTSQG